MIPYSVLYLACIFAFGVGFLLAGFFRDAR